MRLIALIFFLQLLAFVGFSQEEQNHKQLQEVEISVARMNRYYVDSINVYLTKEDIEILQPDDLGELLKKLPGVNVKSYGGLGGMKTVSIRGLGGQHTNFVIDGFSQTQTQTGQVNIGGIQLDDIQSVMIQRGGASELNLPSMAQLSGNAIILETFNATSPRQPLQQKLYSKFGSFGQIEQYYLAKTGGKKVYGGLFLKYRQADGAYPYRYKNYQTTVEGIRKNNDYMDINGGFNLHYRIHENHLINAYFQHGQMDHGVPGAVVLYNDLAKQRLKNENTSIRLDYHGKVKFFQYRIFYTYMKDSLFYLDPDYLNIEGKLEAKYGNHSHDFGVNTSKDLGQRFKLNVGAQEIISQLNSHAEFKSQPQRYHFSSFAKITYSHNRLSAMAQIGYQNIKERNDEGIEAKNRSRFNPFAQVKYHFTEKIALLAYYRNSFRMPNFNELYYNNVGNSNLNPERANQIALNFNWTFVDRNRIYVGIQSGIYYQEVNDMILTIPTKNLFTWSVQNVGRNQIKGVDLIASFSWNIHKSWTTQITANYTFQESIDLTNSESPSYRHQIAYSPKHSANGDFSLNYKSLGIRFSTFYTSARYILNENIPSNMIDGFATVDMSLYNRFKLDKSNTIQLQLTIKNLGDHSYAFVKNYIMPGRHILFTFTYAFI